MPDNFSQMNSYYDPSMNMGYDQMDPSFDSRQMMGPFMMPMGMSMGMPMGFSGFNQFGDVDGFGDFDDVFFRPMFHHHIHHHFFHFPMGFGFTPFRRF